MSYCMTQEDAMNMSNEQAIQILEPLYRMMFDQHGCPVSNATFALEKAINALGKQPKTNADRFRNMTDEELAKYFSNNADCDTCPNELDRECCVNEDACINKWLKWLKQEAEI